MWSCGDVVEGRRGRWDGGTDSPWGLEVVALVVPDSWARKRVEGTMPIGSPTSASCHEWAPISAGGLGCDVVAASWRGGVDCGGSIW